MLDHKKLVRVSATPLSMRDPSAAPVTASWSRAAGSQKSRPSRSGLPFGYHDNVPNGWDESSRDKTCAITKRSAVTREVRTEMARLNKIIHLLENRKPAFGAIVNNGSYDDIRDLADREYDFLILDMEHARFDFSALVQSLDVMLNRRRIVESGSMMADPVPLVRIPPNGREMNQWIVKQTLDAGAYGIVAPHVSSVEDARSIVQAMRYPRPGGEGQRGSLPTAAMRYWGLQSRPEYFERADLWPEDPEGEIFLLLLIESPEGIQNLADILEKVDGISAVCPGLGDLSTALGYPGNPNHPAVQEQGQRVLEICLEADVPCCSVTNPSAVVRRFDEGYRLMVLQPEKSADGLEAGRVAAQR